MRPAYNPTVKEPRILIVDDDAGQRSLLDSFLKSQGFDTIPVASGEKALEVLRTGAINMMISDVRMPGISGLETLRQARQQHAVLPVLLVTAFAEVREAVGAMRDGALNYLSKPIDLDELLASVRQATGLAVDAPLKFNEDKLLHATQDGRFQRIGSNAEVQTNARILAATNRNLEEEVKAGRFREDLFYRLNVVELNIPPLRERPEDILPLASQFITEFTHGRARFSSSVADCLVRYSWPGNVRELHNAMERAALLSRGELLLP